VATSRDWFTPLFFFASAKAVGPTLVEACGFSCIWLVLIHR
jgi:hypothetical protein